MILHHRTTGMERKNPSTALCKKAKIVIQFSSNCDVEMLSLINTFKRSLSNQSYIALKVCRIIPDVISIVPKEQLSVTFLNGHEVKLGNDLKPSEVTVEPLVQWNCEHNKYYTLLMIDPDAPSRKSPSWKCQLHWLIGNIPNCDIRKGDVLAEYIGAAPLKNSGSHRYVFLVYKQENYYKFSEKNIPKNVFNGREKFNLSNFALNYSLGHPIAVNFFHAEWDPFVGNIYGNMGV